MFNAEMLARVKELAERPEGPKEFVTPMAIEAFHDGQAILARDLLKNFPPGAIIFLEDIVEKDEVRVQASFTPALTDDDPPTPAQCMAITVLQQLKPEDIEPEASPAEAAPASIPPAESPPQEDKENSNE